MNDTQNQTTIEMVSISVTFTFVGAFVNSIVLYAIIRPNFNKREIFRYLLISSVLNSIFGLIVFLAFFQKLIEENLNKIEREMYLYVTFVVTTFVAWYNVLISIDTFILSKIHKMSGLCIKLKLQILVIMALITFSCLINLQSLYSDTKEAKVNEEPTFSQIIHYGLVEIIVPVILGFIFTIFTFRQIIRMKITNVITNLENVNVFLKIIFGSNLLNLVLNLPYFIVLLLYVCNFLNKNHILFFITEAIRFLCFYCNILIYVIYNVLRRKYYNETILSDKDRLIIENDC